MTQFADVTVITPTITGRATYLERCMSSVQRQSRPVAAHLIVQKSEDATLNKRACIGRARNLALRAVSTKWVAFLDDDNYWLPHVVEMCEHAMDTSADVIYFPTVPIATDDTGSNFVRYNAIDINQWSLTDRLARQRQDNMIDSNSFVRWSMLREIRGFTEDWPSEVLDNGCRTEDHDLYLRLMEHGANFTHIAIDGWYYDATLHGFQASRQRRGVENKLIESQL